MIPYSFLLILYLIAVAIVLIYALINLYHVFRYGRMDAPTYFMTGLFVAGFLVILFISSTAITQIDWSQTIDLLGAFSPNSGANNGF
jgi:hypothetical protein